MNLAQVVELAQIAERGLLDGIFLADGNGVRHLNNLPLLAAMSPSDRPATFEPLTLLSALAMCTKNLGLIATATTTYDEPYSVARRFGSLDHISGGRAGWNVVTTSAPTDALNFNRSEHVDRERRYDRASEFVGLVKDLWDSWADDAFIQDQETGRYLDPTRMKVLNHKGRHFQVQGPLNLARPPQGRPIIFTAGQSDAGLNLAAQHADCVFAIVAEIDAAREFRRGLRARALAKGRDADSIKVIPSATIFVGRTDEEADRLYAELQGLITPELGVSYLSNAISEDLSAYDIDQPFPKLSAEEVIGFQGMRVAILTMAQKENLTIRETYQRVIPARGLLVFKGSVNKVANEIENWYATGACDGFMITAPIAPSGLTMFVDEVVPELQRRRLFRRSYEGTMLRDILGFARPTNRFFS